MRLATKHCKHGTFTYPVNDKWIGRALDIYGEYSELECAVLQQLVKPGWVVVEVGANIGALSVPIARRLGPTGRLIVFEPQPQICPLLSANLIGNKVPCEIQIIEKAVGGSAGHIPMELLDYSAEEVNSGGCQVGKGDGQVEVVRIDDLQLPELHFLKADVEGFEPEVLRGARETIKRLRPLLYIEADRSERRNELLELLDELGYACWLHSPPLFNPDNWARQERNVFWPYVSLNLFCTPRENSVIGVDGMEQVYFPRHDREFDRLMSFQPPAGKTVCVARQAAIGDALQLSSVLKPLKEEGYDVTILTWPAAAQVLAHDPHIDHILTVSPDFGPPTRLFELFDAYKARFERFILLDGVTEHTLLLAPNTTEHFHWPQAARHRLCNHNYLDLLHDVAGVPRSFGQRFYPTDKEAKEALRWRESKQQLCVLAPSGTGKNKRWPHAGRLCDFMLEQMPGMEIAVVGNVDPADYALHPRLHVLGMSMPLRFVLALAQQADVVIGQETGVLNAVAMEDMLKIVLLSHSSRENLTRDWVNTVALEPGVDCYPCHRLHPTFDHCAQVEGAAACMWDHRPAQVCALVKSRLQVAA